MKERLKVLSVLLICCLILAVTGCGSVDTAGKVTAPEEETDAAVAGTETPNSQGIPYKRGSVNDGVYTNEFLKIGCELDEDWTYYDEEQLNEESGLAPDEGKGMTLSELTKKSGENDTRYHDMFAEASVGVEFIVITYDNLERFGGSIDESTYRDFDMATMPHRVDATIYTDTTYEKTTIELAGESRLAVAVSSKFLGVPMYTKTIYIQQGDFMAIIAILSTHTDSTDDLAGKFYSLE